MRASAILLCAAGLTVGRATTDVSEDSIAAAAESVDYGDFQADEHRDL